MTNKEILQADMLDILFEHRNKAYGAYALRRNYDRRLLIALGTAMSLVLLFILIGVLDNNEATADTFEPQKKEVITTYVIPPDNPKQPEKPKEVIKPKEKFKAAEKVSAIKHLVPVITPDDKVLKNDMPDKDELKEKAVGDENRDGRKPAGIVQPVQPTIPGNGKFIDEEETTPGFIGESIAPEFPGGMEALRKYFSKNLDTPGELNSGEKKTVRVRFWVGKDGAISALEIEQTGGDIFDKEVIRVCRKMPRWKPAMQNGENVAVSYLLPVTFIGVEQ